MPDDKDGDEELRSPSEQNVEEFKEMISLLRAAGHQVHVAIFSVVPRARTDTCDPGQLSKFEQVVSVFKCAGSGQNALVDMGTGFWEEIRRMWDENRWFEITTSENSELLAKMLDRYIMRQKVLLRLEVDQSFAADYASKTKLLRAVGKCHSRARLLYPSDAADDLTRLDLVAPPLLPHDAH